MTEDTQSEQEPQTEAEAWDARYSENERMWSGNPNDELVREAADLPPGRALDLGCGEGADTIWLAQRGWRVTGTDISRVALDRAAEHVAEAGVTERVELRWDDLGETFPSGPFDLISAQFLHSRGELPRERILRTATEKVAPDGVLLIVGHADWPSFVTERPTHEVHFPTTEEVLAELKLPDGEWEVLRCAEYERPQTSPDGEPCTRKDNTVMVRRISG
ncbi:SAM-dependent methyltransferase [Streptomyces oceani]|uniref:SAM-dependent methyltransferase n=1 Tax=Streptomyces oceani TaxID=1075402 RepID=A0A1E7JWY0_9ACTN|nr:class I SAM-dependent methyltransferase [Streptomyces oceani]OEU96171.1 SAM-dependent methyltransferase [Streptomyces oceani]